MSDLFLQTIQNELATFTPLFISIFGGLLAYYRKQLHSWIGEQKYLKGFKSKVKLDDLMQDIVAIGSDRVLLFEGTNNGGWPRAGHPYWVSNIGAKGSGLDADANKAYADRFDVDADYVKLLRKMIDNDMIYLEIATMHDGLIKSLYHMEGLTHSYWFFIGVSGKTLHFMSASSHLDAPLTEDQLTRIGLKVRRIRKEIMGF